MIKELFLPRAVGRHYLFPTRVLGFDISKTSICATQAQLKGSSVKIEKYIEMQLENGTTNNHSERTASALKAIIAQCDSYDQINTALPSSVVIFKELRLPFLTYETIKKVVPYEVEPLLPFSIGEAVIDFVITKEHPEQGSSEVLVAAIQNHHIAQHMQLFADAGVNPDLITIDLFAVYELYKKLPAYASVVGGVMLIDINMHLTRIAYVQNGQLRFIRTINKGLYHPVKAIGETLNLQPHEVMDNLLRFGLESNNNASYMQAIETSFTAFLHEIQFTLQSFTTQTQQPTVKILLFGTGAQLKGMDSFVGSQLQTPCQIMVPATMVQGSAITIKTKAPLPSSSIISLSTAVAGATQAQVNLRQGIFEPATDALFNRQLVVAICLSIVLIGSFSTYSFLQIRAMRNEALASEKEALDSLKEREHFAKILQEKLKDTKDKDKLEEAVHLAEKKIQELEKMWSAFTDPAQSSALQYLLEITEKIDKDALGFTLESLTIADNAMTIKARVRNHEALNILEKELASSKLFSVVPKQEKTEFTMKITLAKTGEGR